MKPKMFEELLESVREGGAIVRGQRKASRRFELGSSGIRAIRERTSLSQSAFASLIGVSVKTLQNWEQDRRRPTGPAATLLRIIAYDPRLAVQAIHQTYGPGSGLIYMQPNSAQAVSRRSRAAPVTVETPATVHQCASRRGRFPLQFAPGFRNAQPRIFTANSAWWARMNSVRPPAPPKTISIGRSGTSIRPICLPARS